MCAGDHRTDECKKTDPGSYRCVNCNEAGHASWDRMCPRFMDASERAEQANPENTSPQKNPGHGNRCTPVRSQLYMASCQAKESGEAKATVDGEIIH